MPDLLNIAVFASGKGSNFQAILDAIKAGKIPNARIALVISNNSTAGALEIARNNRIPALHVSRQQFGSDETFNKALLKKLTDAKVNFVVLAGYMKMLDSSIIGHFKNRIVNIHPALLPKFGGKGMYGIHVHEAVIANKERMSGATVHLVDEEYDCGPIVLQRTVEVAPNDTPESLAAKVLEIEHQLYPEAVRLFAEGQVKVNGQNVMIASA
ncbi:MAG: phosphoribosylglycinamide formyltransferase [Bacteroidota bacterium]